MEQFTKRFSTFAAKRTRYGSIRVSTYEETDYNLPVGNNVSMLMRL